MISRRDDIGSIAERSALLLSPSRGFGGGIERVVSALEAAWPSPTTRLDLYQPDRHTVAAGERGAQALFASRAAAEASRKHPGIVVCLHAGLLPVALAAGALARAPICLVAYGTEVWAPMGRVRRMQIQRCDRVIAISRFTAQWLARRATIPEDRVRILPLPISECLAAGAQAGLRADAEQPRETEPLMVTVSRLNREHRYKGHFAVAEAWPAVIREVPDARWLIVGDGDDRPQLERRCAGMRSVVLLGRISDAKLADVYRRATALVLPSIADPETTPPRGEGFGLVYAEAGAFGVPSVASTQGGGAEDFVIDGITGLTVPPGDPAPLIKALVELLRDGRRSVELGSAARRRTWERHWPDDFPARLRSVLDSGRRLTA